MLRGRANPNSSVHTNFDFPLKTKLCCPASGSITYFKKKNLDRCKKQFKIKLYNLQQWLLMLILRIHFSLRFKCVASVNRVQQNYYDTWYHVTKNQVFWMLKTAKNVNLVIILSLFEKKKNNQKIKNILKIIGDLYIVQIFT